MFSVAPAGECLQVWSLILMETWDDFLLFETCFGLLCAKFWFAISLCRNVVFVLASVGLVRGRWKFCDTL